MKKKIYWKDIGLSFTKSKGRFFSIFSLMMIGAIALVGLKVTTPNMEHTAQNYAEKYQMMDMAVMADYGLSDADVKELSAISGAKVEFGYLSDVTISDTDDAIRIFSQTETISQFELVAGRMPETQQEIALASTLMGKYAIGSQISFATGDKSPLKEKTYTVTGFVNSSEIWNQQSMGASSVGTGQLTAYAVTTPTAFDSDVYMIARLTYEDVAKIPYYQSSYQKAIAKHQKELESLLADNGPARLKALKEEGQKKIDDGKAEIATSEKELADAEQKIKDGQAQVTDGESQLSAAKQEVADGEAELAASSQRLEAAKAQLEQSKQQLADADSRLTSTKFVLDTTKNQLDKVAEQLAQAKATLDEKKQQLDALAAQISDGQFQLQTAKTALQNQINSLLAAGQDPNTNPDVLAAQAKIQEQEAKLAEAQQQYNDGFTQYQNGFSQYSSRKTQYETGLAQHEDALSQYNYAKEQYDAGVAQYETGQQQYQTGLAQYEAGQAKIATAKEEISRQEAQLTAAKEELDAAKKSYEDGSKDAQKKIKDAKTQLQQAQKDVDELKEPTYTAYSRSTLPGGSGYDTYQNATESISAVGNIFPVVLYLVAALVAFTTMTRFVDEERNNAGILRALGYTSRQVIAKFVLYGMVASLLGTVVGIIAGNFLLSPIIGNITTQSTVIGQSNLYFYLSWTLLAIALSFLSAVLPAYLVARKELREKPAQLLQAKPPVSGSAILLEKVSFIWDRLSFTHKVTARNIFRYKQRMLMTIFGVAGTVALLFAGLGIQSSISGIADTQFGELIRYDMIVAQKETATADELNQLKQAIQSDEIDKSQQIQFISLEESISGVKEEQSVSLLISKTPEISDFIQLRTRGKQAISLTNQGAVFSEKLASLYGVTVGDKVVLQIDEQPVTVRVAAISEMYAGHFIYMTAQYYETASNNSYQPNAYLVKLHNSSTKHIQAVAADFLAMSGVSGVAQNTALIALINTIANSLQTVMIVLVILSVLLAVVILYNLTNINVAERIRELSTIKVLGFHNKEVTLYIYRETIVLSVVGILAGLISGYFLHKVILEMIASDAVMFKPAVSLYVYLVPIFVITGILAVLGWMVNYKLRRVDMLEALKSVE